MAPQTRHKAGALLSSPSEFGHLKRKANIKQLNLGGKGTGCSQNTIFLTSGSMVREPNFSRMGTKAGPLWWMLLPKVTSSKADCSCSRLSIGQSFMQRTELSNFLKIQGFGNPLDYFMPLGPKYLADIFTRTTRLSQKSTTLITYVNKEASLMSSL